LKMDSWSRLPWLLCGLASTKTQTQIDIAQRAIAQFDKDPRRSCHHRLTWAFLHPGGPLRSGLDWLARGAPLGECNSEFREAVAGLRMTIVVETTIEAKHARVSLARRTHYVGPVRVSLSNRLPLLER
jgi:hypothetical protein